jgi:hypothetical protein
MSSGRITFLIATIKINQLNNLFKYSNIYTLQSDANEVVSPVFKSKA